MGHRAKVAPGEREGRSLQGVQHRRKPTPCRQFGVMKDRGWNSHLQRLKREGRWERGVGMVKRGVGTD